MKQTTANRIDRLERARYVSELLRSCRMQMRREDPVFAAREDVAVARARASWEARERYLEDHPEAYPFA